MCGIAGFVTTRPADRAARALRAMTDALAHRGPDGDGAFHEAMDATGARVALGHRRLAIIDVAAGAQPLVDDGDRHVIVYNGEIYNYVEIREELAARGERFRTASDTEVLLRAYAVWGEACLSRLRGMYAFAIYDRAERALFLARDPFGKKPLFHFRRGGEFVFASELAALATHPAFPAEIDDGALAQYLIYKYAPGPRTLLRGVEELPPGCCATLKDGRLTTRRHYAPPRREPDPARRVAMDADGVALFRDTLRESVRLRMRSDVPVGAFLSGGLDSSSIVSLMSEMSPHAVRTFSVGFEDETYSELWAARLVAEKHGADHAERVITPDDFLDCFEAATWARGAPLTEMADIPLYLLSRLAAEKVKVVLSGEGADELLAGYPKHWGDLLLARWQGVAPAALDPLRSALPSRLTPYRFRRLAILLRVARERGFMDRQAAWFGLMGAGEAAALCPSLFADYAPPVWELDPGPEEGPLHRALMFDKTVWLPGTLLERGDRMTMAASLEGRMPFMDVELAALAARLDDAAFLDGRSGKTILRRAMAGVLPEAVLTRPKVGFRVPVGDWFRDRLRPHVEEMLLGADSRFGPRCDLVRLRAVVDDHMSGRRNREKELWSLLTLETFLRQIERDRRVDLEREAAA